MILLPGHLVAQPRSAEDLYIHGRGYLDRFTPDYESAEKWFRLAAERGLADAQFNLGLLYLEGKGVPQSEFEARNWFLRAAEQRHAPAQVNLAILYATAAIPDLVQAYMWLSLSLDPSPREKALFDIVYLKRGEATERRARKVRESVAGQMTPQERARATQLAEEWRARHSQ